MCVLCALCPATGGPRGGFERAIELLREHGEPTLVVGREPALSAGSDDEDGVDADGGDVHCLCVDWEEGFELDAAGEEDEVGEVVAGGAPDGLVANRTEGRRGFKRRRFGERVGGFPGLEDAGAVAFEDSHDVAVGSVGGGVPGPEELSAQAVVGLSVRAEIRRLELGANEIDHVRGFRLECYPCKSGEHEARGHGETDDVCAALRARCVGHRSDATQGAVCEQYQPRRHAERRRRRAQSVAVTLN